MVHFVASGAVVLMGLALALLLGADSNIRMFGWLLVVIGLLGFVSRWVISVQSNKRTPPR
jgi:hypothetical protein